MEKDRKEYFKKYYQEHKNTYKERNKKNYKKNTTPEFVVYVRTNLENGMKYIGQTSDFKRRQYQWEKSKRYANSLLDSDRWNYRFDVEILARTDSREKAWELEKRLIKELGTLYPNGYNIDEGGEIRGRGYNNW